MREALLISKPIAPPWTDSNKNLVRDLARAMTRTRARVMVPEGQDFEGAISEPVYRVAGAYALSSLAALLNLPIREAPVVIHTAQAA